MKKLFWLLVLVCGVSFGQETEFAFSKDGFTDFVVAECPGKTQNELYKKSIDWLAVTYKNPKEVLKAQIENDYIRFEGSAPGLVTITNLMTFNYPTTYQIEVSFKEGKYKFDVTEVKYYISPSKYGPGGWYDFSIKETAEYYNKKGLIKGSYKRMPEALTTYFNNLNKEMKDFFMSDAIPSKKSDW